MNRLNDALRQKDQGGELRVGHAYFLANTELTSGVDELKQQVARKWEHQVQQLLQEYDRLMNLGVKFFERFPEGFGKALQCQ